MTMAHHGGRLVDERSSLLEGAEEHLEIAAAVCRCTDVEGRIEQTDAVEERAAKGHVGASAERTGAAELRRLRQLRPPLVVEPIESTSEAAVGLEETLHIIVDFIRDDEAGDDIDSRIRRERPPECERPSVIDAHIVIGERDHLAACFEDRTVPRPVETRARLDYVA